MSDVDRLADKIAAVIADHLAETSGGMLTGFVFSADYIDDEGDRAWLHAQARDQSITSTLGILRWYTLYAEDVSLRSMRDEVD